jgi:hypothetical protein
MSGALHLAALVAIVPAMLGPPHGGGGTLMLTLCGGGTLAVEIPGDPAPRPDSQACVKGCHSGCSRKRIDRAQ